MSTFDESQFRAKVDTALETVRKILDNTRDPKLAGDVPHKYDDKYALAEFMSKTTLAAQLNVLESLGVTGPQLQQMIEWAKTRSVTLRLKAEEKCTFIKKEKRKVENPVAHVTEVKVGFLSAAKITDKSYTKITEWFWKFEVNWALFAYTGTSVESGVVIQGRSAACELVTTVEAPPHPAALVRPSIEFNVSWLLSHLANGRMDFHINRAAPTCRTPRRNAEIEEARRECALFETWCGQVASYFTNTLFPTQPKHGLDLGALHARNVFVPVLDLMEGEGQVLAGDLGALLAEQSRALGERRAELAATFPPPPQASLISLQEAQLVVSVLHGGELFQAFTDSIDYIEHMLYTQLTAAIGKIVTPLDFANYMNFHQRKLFAEAYVPRGLSYPVRRGTHYPEGAVGLEAVGADGKMADPVPTLTRSFPAEKPCTFPLDAATTLSFTGDRHVHAWINQSFSGTSGQTLQLVARARQFSSYIIVIGRLNSATQLEPKYALLIKDKDDVRVPLLMETLPTPKEFADAIESMSPEQQRFCKAYRAMQLESTLLGVAVLQIKPQLEKLLRLPDDSLTKEIKLTQELLNLFIEYNIPSDLLSYAGPAEAPGEEKLRAVQGYVAEMKRLIEESKKEQLEDARQQAQARAAERNVILTSSLESQSISLSLPTSAVRQSSSVMMDSKKGGGRGGSSVLSRKRMTQAVPASAPAPSAPVPQPQQQAQVQQPSAPEPSAPEPTQPEQAKGAAELDSEEEIKFDFTKIPQQLDEAFGRLDEDSALRPTILNIGPIWSKSFKRGLLSPVQQESLGTPEQQREKARAWDLLDALTRSGTLPIDYATLHVIIAATHTFTKSLIDTVVQDNVNPIEKVERSLLIVASVLHGVPVSQLVNEDEIARVTQLSPKLFK